MRYLLESREKGAHASILKLECREGEAVFENQDDRVVAQLGCLLLNGFHV